MPEITPPLGAREYPDAAAANKAAAAADTGTGPVKPCPRCGGHHPQWPGPTGPAGRRDGS